MSDGGGVSEGSEECPRVVTHEKKRRRMTRGGEA